jgi:hypothetical protein
MSVTCGSTDGSSAEMASRYYVALHHAEKGGGSKGKGGHESAVDL